MILTCPACDTKYVVKDNAIPPGGRQVRCASCKHSWHQNPEVSEGEPAEAGKAAFGDQSPPADGFEEAGAAGLQTEAAKNMDLGESQPDTGEAEESPWGAVSAEPGGSALPIAGAAGPDEVAMEEAPAVADEWRVAAVDEVPDETPEAVAASPEPAATDEEFAHYSPIAGEDDRPARRWPLVFGILLLIAAAAAAFWFFAPPEWKARAGLAQAGATPLQLMITTSDRQSLQSGNELVAISGRVINPTDREQQVPPILAELRDKQSKRVVHRWTIAPPARVLAPRSSATFNSAEVDVPKGGDELTVTLGS
ncbi:MAG TPA: MJ0042-type zinc finger domain-containing protein [Sphingomicrobium sp.]|nr:MJ0042-type zinc finger domain-containing protein [Sphingomicrobium sp.]